MNDRTLPSNVDQPQTRRRPFVAKVKKSNGNWYPVAADDRVAEWRERLKGIFATSSPLFVDACLRQLVEASKLPRESVASTTSLSAAIELIASLEPENEAQAALAIHITCLHMASMNVLSRITNVTERNVVAMATAGAKLERAYQLAMETYSRIKHGNRQVVRIERVEIQAGAQALIGDVRR